MKTCILTDTNSGITPEIAKEMGVEVLKMPVIINGETYYEGDTITDKQFYEYQNNNADITTSQVSPGVVTQTWDNLLKVYDAIIYIPMSSGLSQSCDIAKILAEDYKGKVFVLDNKRISVTQRNSVEDALNLIKEGKTAEQIYNILLKESRNNMIFIMVDTLKELKKGGRVTAAGAALGATFHIKPILKIEGGKLDAYAKSIGVKKAKLTMLNAIKEYRENEFKDFKDDELQYDVAYTNNLEDAKVWKQEVEEFFNIKVCHFDPLSLSIATHIGTGALVVTISRRLK